MKDKLAGIPDWAKIVGGIAIIGGAIWVTGLSLLGFFLGNIPIVKENFEMVILGIIFVSVLPIIIEFIRHRRKKKN